MKLACREPPLRDTVITLTDSSDYTVDNPLKRNEAELTVTTVRIFWKIIRYLEGEECLTNSRIFYSIFLIISRISVLLFRCRNVERTVSS